MNVATVNTGKVAAQYGVRMWARINRLLLSACTLCTLLAILPATSVHAADRESLYGEWGTEAQCARALITPNGTKRAAPFDIRPGWLANGEMWCQLTWGIAVPNEDGLFAVATALCGEDTVRGYDVKFRLTGDQLTLIWGLWIRNGPLLQCSD